MQAQEGVISITATEEITMQTTRYGINAVVHKIVDFFKAHLPDKADQSQEQDNNDKDIDID